MSTIDKALTISTGRNTAPIKRAGGPAIFIILVIMAAPLSAFSPDDDYLHDRAVLEELQKEAFLCFWEGGEPNSGMAYEADFGWEVRPVAVGGTGFGVASVVVAADRGWITREQALARLIKITGFLLGKSPRRELHGAFPHWLDGATGEALNFGGNDNGADLVETSLLIQGLLIARAYFNGPGVEEDLRCDINEIWEGVEWDWFTNKENKGLYWHWSPKKGFSGLKILGFNKCLITYILALSSPTHPISRQAYNYWTSGSGYRPKKVFGYEIEASLNGAGPLFLPHYSFIGLDPRLMADGFVTQGYFTRNLKHVLSNRGYCLQNAPSVNRYAEDFWGLTASQVKWGYEVSEPKNDTGTIAPTGALSSIVYTPHYSMEVLFNLRGRLKSKIWGAYGPYDAISLRDDWVSPHYLAIDQLPIVLMVENYRSGLLWRLMMSTPEIGAGLKKAGMSKPDLEEGFPEAVVTLKKSGKKYAADAYDIRRHPDSGLYSVPYWCAQAGPVRFSMVGPDGAPVFSAEEEAAAGRNYLKFPQFKRKDGEIILLEMTTGPDKRYSLPLRLN